MLRLKRTPAAKFMARALSSAACKGMYFCSHSQALLASSKVIDLMPVADGLQLIQVRWRNCQGFIVQM